MQVYSKVSYYGNLQFCNMFKLQGKKGEAQFGCNLSVVSVYMIQIQSDDTE